VTPVFAFQLHEIAPWIFVAVAFLIGSIPFGLIVSRVFFKTDIRTAGSGNIGAANALRTMGRKAGIAVLVLDALKGVTGTLLPILLFPIAFPQPVPVDCNTLNLPPQTDCSVGYLTKSLDAFVFPICAWCALATIVGHCYSPWLRFRGGKGVATYLGVLFVAGWPSALAFVVVWLAIVLPLGLASLGSILGAATAAAVVAAIRGPWTLAYSVPAVAIIVWQHRDNIRRLIAGNENRLDLLKR